ncbi:probable protein phosphatase 2C 12 isoform X5 [Glycine max]|uniref:probable protein phosphatase 2C 12 isoform X5 n=1 Tax=Glycine max TaxID=3847 RepID=UPI001B356882|nr:probable protein phosphatase 2C 12 isoform X5 [Glycine max]
MSAQSEHQSVSLSVLLKRELANEKNEKPEVVILHGQASENKKGEDFTLLKTECQRVLGDGVSTYSVFGLFDGHNGSAAAIYAKENLLNNVLSAIPSDLNRDEWVAALPRALVAGFVKTDKDFQEKAQTSGTTVTFMITEGWVVTVASVGDSRCILEPSEGGIYYLSADHRLESNEEERVRITSSGGEVGRLNTGGGTEVGPLRCWPGGLCLSRSIGDMDVGEFIVPVPHVKQVKLSTAGGRIILSSDGVWDALSAEMALDCCRGMSPEAAATHIVKVRSSFAQFFNAIVSPCNLCHFVVCITCFYFYHFFLSLFFLQESVQAKGLRDDTTCIVIDILPQEKPPTSVLTQKKPVKGMLKSIFRKKSSESSSFIDKEYLESDVVQELYEEGSAMLSERLETKYPLCNMFKPFTCAVCQVEIKPGEGISIHEGVPNPGRLRPSYGPFLCPSCQEKKEAMEGKRTSDRLSSGSD